MVPIFEIEKLDVNLVKLDANLKLVRDSIAYETMTLSRVF